MINLLLSLLSAITSNLDTLAVSIAYNIKGIKINKNYNFLISLISTFGTFISMLFGKYLNFIIPINCIEYICSFILIFIGIYFIFQFYIEKKANSNSSNYLKILKNPLEADFNKSGTLELNEIIVLGLTLTINNLGVGVSISIAGVDIWLMTILTFIMTFIFIEFGSFIVNSKIFKLIGEYASLLSGIIIIIIGLFSIII